MPNDDTTMEAFFNELEKIAEERQRGGAGQYAAGIGGGAAAGALAAMPMGKGIRGAFKGKHTREMEARPQTYTGDPRDMDEFLSKRRKEREISNAMWDKDDEIRMRGYHQEQADKWDAKAKTRNSSSVFGRKSPLSDESISDTHRRLAAGRAENIKELDKKIEYGPVIDRDAILEHAKKRREDIARAAKSRIGKGALAGAAIGAAAIGLARRRKRQDKA